MPDTALLLDHVRLGIRPLIVCDIDEVVLEFITPLKAFLRANGYDFIARAYKLKGNIISVTDGTEIEQAQISDLLEAFFLSQHDWQTPAEHAVETLHSLADEADIVFLTAMAPRHQAVRRALLDSFDLPFPLVPPRTPRGRWSIASTTAAPCRLPSSTTSSATTCRYRPMFPIACWSA